MAESTPLSNGRPTNDANTPACAPLTLTLACVLSQVVARVHECAKQASQQTNQPASTINRRQLTSVCASVRSARRVMFCESNSPPTEGGDDNKERAHHRPHAQQTSHYIIIANHNTGRPASSPAWWLPRSKEMVG